MVDNRTPQPDTGASFIEVLVAVVLLGITGIAILVSMSAATVGARTSDDIATVQARLAEAVTYLTDTDPAHIDYRPCTDTGLLAAYQTALSAHIDVEIVAVTYWNSTTSGFGTTCRHDDGDRLQQIELRSTIGQVERTATVVKRPITSPDAGTVPAPPAPLGHGGSRSAEVEITNGVNG